VLDETGFASFWLSLKNHVRSHVGARDLPPDGAIRGERVVPLSEGISKGIVHWPARSGWRADPIIASRNAERIRMIGSKAKQVIPR